MLFALKNLGKEDLLLKQGQVFAVESQVKYFTTWESSKIVIYVY